MTHKRDWPCWEIMQCNPENAKQCPAYNSPNPCWEVMRELDAYSFNICSDCIVYVIKQKDSIFSNAEIMDIMNQKGLGVQCPQYSSPQEESFLENN